MTIQQTLSVNQGETFSFSVRWVGADLSGCTAKMQIKTAPGGTAIATFTSSPASGIVISGDTVTVTVSAAMSTGWTFASSVYDLLLTLSDTTTKRLIEGLVNLKAQVTT